MSTLPPAPILPPAPTDAPTLPPSVLASSLRHMASDAALAPLTSRLRHGKPIHIGVLGASVAADGGCLEQKYARCMTPRFQREGMWVHALRVINQSWPHAEHKLYNGAVDATPAQQFRQCMHGLLPPSPHLIFLEFGSMARFLNLVQTELLVRQLLSLPSAPALVFFTVREFCATAHLAWKMKHTPHKEEPDLPADKGPHARAEHAFESLCEQYDLTCLSYYHAFAPLYLQRAANFTRADVAADCLHPTTGRFGTAYARAIVRHWIGRAAASVRLAPGRHQHQRRELPPPAMEGTRALLQSGKLHPGSARCFAFRSVESASSGKARSRARVEQMRWGSAHCGTGEWMGQCVHSRPSNHPGERTSCPVSRSVGAAPASSVRHGWFACDYALVFNRTSGEYVRGKRTDGVVALRPGATIEFGVAVEAWRPLRRKEPLEAGRDAANLPRACATLHYLTSYERQGRAAVSCFGSCRCDPFVLDAHSRPSRGGRRVSITAERGVELSVSNDPSRPSEGASSTSIHRRSTGEASCYMRLRLLNETSSGGHHFKLQMLTVTLAGCSRG
uniref:SGNH hydrolase-type esterase domain-containing protein n=1 Tax=Emiliania huxleyi TaxID=2903 RepID=A0A7S3W8L1_EMIHU